MNGEPAKIEPMALLTTAEAATFCRRSPATIRWWVHKGWLTPHGTTNRTNLFLDTDVITADNTARGVAA